MVKNGAKGAIFLSGILLLTLNLGAYYFYYQQLQSQQKILASLAHYFDQTRATAPLQQLEKVVIQQAQEVVQIKQQIALQSQQQHDLQRQVKDFPQERLHHDHLLHSALHWINNAVQQLTLRQDVILAIQFLHYAELHLAACNDPQLLVVRQAIARDVAQLKTIHLPEESKVVEGLLHLLEHVAQLPLSPTGGPLITQQVGEPSAGEPCNKWIRWLRYRAPFTQKFFIIRPLDEVCTPLYTTLLDYWRENIRIHLLSAVQAVWRHRADVYQRHLHHIMQLVSAHFDIRHQQVKAFLDQIDALRAQSIAVLLPQQLESQQLLSLVSRPHSQQDPSGSPLEQVD